MKLYGRSVNYSLFVCVLFMCKSSYEQTCTIESMSLDATENKRVTPVQKSISLLGPNGCFDECIRRVDCYSFNYNKKQLLCELVYTPNGTDKENIDYVNKNVTGSIDGPRDPCPGTRCATGHICLTLYDSTTICVTDG